MGLTAGTPGDIVKRKPIIAVIGAASADEVARNIAGDVGRGIAREGWHLLTGGGAGVMAAASRGFQAGRHPESGQVIGMLPTETDEFANDSIDIVIPTGMGMARNALIARTADALIAVGGCSGTLSEMALAWQLGRPIAACVGAGGWAGKMAGIAIDRRFDEPIFAAKTADDSILFVKSRINP